MNDDSYNSALLDIQRSVSGDVRKNAKSVLPNTFNPITYPFGKMPGANKAGLKVCVTCERLIVLKR
jgi:hypothetical protein